MFFARLRHFRGLCLRRFFQFLQEAAHGFLVLWGYVDSDGLPATLRLCRPTISFGQGDRTVGRDKAEGRSRHSFESRETIRRRLDKVPLPVTVSRGGGR
jgi:hypothetical protein